MKKLILLLLFIPLVSFGQDDVTVVAVKTETNILVPEERTDADTKVKVPLSVNFNDYTHIAIADVLNSAGKRPRSAFKNVYNALLASPLTIINPSNDKKKFKANSFYLRNIKNSKWLYLYYTASRMGVDVTISIVIRDYNNTIVYSATSMNVPFREVLSQVANF